MAQSVPVFAVPAWTSPNSRLDEMMYVKYYERDGGGKKGDREIKIQLLSCFDTDLQLCLL